MKELDHRKVLSDYDGSLYPSAMLDENSAYPKLETGFVFKLDMNEVYLVASNIQTFNQENDESAVLKKIQPSTLINISTPSCERKGQKQRS